MTDTKDAMIEALSTECVRQHELITKIRTLLEDYYKPKSI